MAKKRKLENKSPAEPPNNNNQAQPSEPPTDQQQPPPPENKQEQQEIDQQENDEHQGVDTTTNNNINNNEDGIEATGDAQAAEPQVDGGNAEEADDSEEEPVEKLLEHFTKDQVVDLLREAAEKHPDVLETIRRIADADPVHRKIFVHGLGWDTNAETLINAFKEYGEIEDCKAVSDKISGKSKGYGFILFKRRSGARKALKEPQKKIGNRMTACQLAAAGPVPQHHQQQQQQPVAVSGGATASEYTQRKIYVSNVSADIDPQKLLNFFAKFGEIVEGPLGLDKQTGKPKGFTLFVYKTVESARKALEEPHKNFEGHILHCQRAIDGPKHSKSQFQNQSSGGSGIGSQYRSGGGSNFAAAGDVGGAHHLMAPSGVPFNQGGQPLNPVLGQALTALLAGQGGGLGLNNILGTIGSSGMAAPLNQSVQSMVGNVGHGMQGGYGSQASSISPALMGGYGNPHGVQGGYPNPQMGQGGAGRSQGAGHLGGVAPYMGH